MGLGCVCVGLNIFLRLVAPSKCASSIFILVHVLWSHSRCARGSPSVLFECLLKFCFSNALDKFAAARMLAL